MTNKKNKLITFFVSLLPGAGEMYLGFYKMGGSIMVLFWGGIMMFGNLFPPLFYLLPVLWFFSFFHTHNLNCMSDEEFYALEDDYLFHMSPEDIRGWTLKNRRLTAFILIFIGVSIIWNHLWSAIWSPVVHPPPLDPGYSPAGGSVPHHMDRVEADTGQEGNSG